MSDRKQLDFWCGQDARRINEDIGVCLLVLCTSQWTLYYLTSQL